MAWLNLLLKGKKVAGKALRPSGTAAIKSVKPGVGGLKKSRDVFEDLQKSVKTGVERFGSPHTTKVLSEQKGSKSMGDIVRRSGEFERKKKALIKKHPEVIDKLK